MELDRGRSRSRVARATQSRRYEMAAPNACNREVRPSVQPALADEARGPQLDGLYAETGRIEQRRCPRGAGAEAEVGGVGFGADFDVVLARSLYPVNGVG